MREPCSGVRTQASTSPWGNAMGRKEYGLIAWRTSDLDALVPQWSERRRQEFLEDNEDELAACQISAGYELIWDRLQSELAMEEHADGD